MERRSCNSRQPEFRSAGPEPALLFCGLRRCSICAAVDHIHIAVLISGLTHIQMRMVTTPEIGQVLGHYRILELIGSGGMGVVFRAHDEQLHRIVALKILPQLSQLSEAARRQFRREALSVARITDQNVAMAFDFGHDKGFDYLVTEYVPGTTLNAKIGGRPLSEGEALHLGKQMASGLESAHRQGVIHRDLKPGNLRVTPEGRLKILDFGLAFLLEIEAEVDGGETASTPITASYQDAGTLPYMSPEQVKGIKPDARADLWSAGAVLYEMATGQAPFGDLTGRKLMAAILEEAPVPARTLNPKISVGLERVILRALEKDPGERYQSAGDLRIDLNSLATGTRPVYAQPRGARRWEWVAAALVTVALAVTGLWWARRHVSESMPGNQVLAILPFEAAADDAPANALGAGLSEMLTAKLVQASDEEHLQLVSTRDLIEQGVKTPDQARREFGTDLALECGIQEHREQIRIACSLVNSRTHLQMAARTVTGAAGDPFNLQDELVEQVLGMLPITVAKERRAELKARAETKPVAYQYYLRGKGYLENYQTPDNLERAIDELQRSIEVDESFAPAHAAMGMAYTRGFKWWNRGKDWIEKGRGECERALALAPKAAEAHACLGNVYLAKGRYEEAVGEIQHAVDLDEKNDETLRLLAEAEQKLGRMRDAEETYRKALALRPNYAGEYSAFGVFYFNEAHYTEAIAMFKRALELAPESYSDYLNLGATYTQTGEYEQATEALKKSVGLHPSFLGYGNLGAVCFFMHRYEESASNLQEALKIDPKDWQNWGNLGDTLFQIPSRRAEALNAYRKAIELGAARLEVNPRDAAVLAYSADYYAMLDLERPAKELLGRALKIAPGDPDVLFRAAICYNHFGEVEKTLDYLEKSVAAGYSVSMIQATPDFDHLRNDSRFRARILKKV